MIFQSIALTLLLSITFGIITSVTSFSSSQPVVTSPTKSGRSLSYNGGTQLLVSQQQEEQEQEDTVEILRGKLKILEQVVEKLNQQKKEAILLESKKYNVVLKKLEKERQIQQDQEETLQEQIIDLNQTIHNLHSYDIPSLRLELVQACEELDLEKAKSSNKLLELKQQYEKELQQSRDETSKFKEKMESLEKDFNDNLDAKVYQIKQLKEQLSKQEEEYQEQLNSIQQRLQQQESSNNQNVEIEKLREELATERTLIKSLQEEISISTNVSKDYEESIEIASAAVQAAEQREALAKQELESCKRYVHQLQVQSKINQMCLDRFERDQQDYEAEIESLTNALNARDTLIDSTQQQEEEEEEVVVQIPGPHHHSQTSSTRRPGLWRRVRNIVKP